MRKKEYDNLGNQNFLSVSNRRDADFDINDEFDDEFDLGSEVQNQMMLMGGRHPKSTRNANRGFKKSTCQQLADIIGGAVITSSPACVVQRNRNINATILGRRTRSPLALPFALSFENNRKGKTLNLGETVILQKEINPFLSALRSRGITVTALHNHWLFDQPRLMYIHWENIGDPFVFAKESFAAAKEAGLF